MPCHNDEMYDVDITLYNTAPQPHPRLLYVMGIAALLLSSLFTLLHLILGDRYGGFAMRPVPGFLIWFQSIFWSIWMRRCSIRACDGLERMHIMRVVMLVSMLFLYCLGDALASDWLTSPFAMGAIFVYGVGHLFLIVWLWLTNEGEKRTVPMSFMTSVPSLVFVCALTSLLYVSFSPLVSTGMFFYYLLMCIAAWRALARIMHIPVITKMRSFMLASVVASGVFLVLAAHLLLTVDLLAAPFTAVHSANKIMSYLLHVIGICMIWAETFREPPPRFIDPIETLST
jgi:hypothetical protein